MSNQIDQSFINNNIPSMGVFNEYEELPPSSISYAKEPENKSLAINGYFHWNNIPVCYEGGTRLFIEDNKPLRANQVEFYIDDLDWSFALNAPWINDPRGNGQPAPGDWFAPGMLQFGILLFQEGVWQRVDPGINTLSIQKPDQDILINVNDKRGTYSDNGGAFDLYLRVIS